MKAAVELGSVNHGRRQFAAGLRTFIVGARRDVLTGGRTVWDSIPAHHARGARRVVFNDDQPAAGASLVVYPADSPGHVVSTATTDSTGAFLRRVPAGVT